MEFTVKLSDFIDGISTKALEEELQERKEYAEENPEAAKRAERRRDDDDITVDIDIDEYGLVEERDIRLETYFSTENMLDYLESQGFELIGKYNIPAFSTMRNWVSNASKWKIRDYFCDMCGVSHTISNDDLMKELRSKIE